MRSPLSSVGNSGTPEVFEDSLGLAHGDERVSQIQTDVDRVFDPVGGRREMVEGVERLFEISGSVPVGGVSKCVPARPAQIDHSLVPDLPPVCMVRKSLDVLC